jgi:hypothetical protein
MFMLLWWINPVKNIPNPLLSLKHKGNKRRNTSILARRLSNGTNSSSAEENSRSDEVAMKREQGEDELTSAEVADGLRWQRVHVVAELGFPAPDEVGFGAGAEWQCSWKNKKKMDSDGGGDLPCWNGPG